MNLILEIVNTPKMDVFQKNMNVGTSGGKIGRSQKATWTLNDPSKHISNMHAEVSFRDGQYFITDISSNGMFLKSPRKQFVKGVPMPLNQKSNVIIGEYEIAVKTVDSTFLSEEPSIASATPSAASAGIPDTFFVGDADKEVFGVIDDVAPEEKDIVSLLSTDEGASANAGMLLPELDSIIGAYESESSMVMNESLNTHIEPPTLDMPEVPTEAPQNNGSDLLKILSLKLGLDLEALHAKEQEVFVSNLADLALGAAEQIRQSQHALDKIQGQLALASANTSRSAKLFSSVKESKEIFSHLKHANSSVPQEMTEMFQEIDKHNIAFYTAFKNISLQTAERFAPDKLQYTFEKKNLLSKNFANKKALAWEAYCETFKHLNDLAADDIDLTHLQKEYNTVYETLSYGSGQK